MSIWNLLHKLGIHKWSYRNPFDRTCDICQKHQQEYARVFEGENPFYKQGWWEDVL